MGPDQAAAVIWSGEVAEAANSKDEATVLEERCQEYRDKYINIFNLMANYRYNFMDDIIWLLGANPLRGNRVVSKNSIKSKTRCRKALESWRARARHSKGK